MKHSRSERNSSTEHRKNNLDLVASTLTVDKTTSSQANDSTLSQIEASNPHRSSSATFISHKNNQSAIKNMEEEKEANVKCSETDSSNKESVCEKSSSDKSKVDTRLHKKARINIYNNFILIICLKLQFLLGYIFHKHNIFSSSVIENVEVL